MFFYTKQAFKVWRSPLHAVFYWNVKGMTKKKAKEHRQIWLRPWALAYSRDRRYNFSCMSVVSKNRRFAVFSRLWVVIWRGKAFLDQQCKFLTRNKTLSSENESNCSMTSECVRTNSICPAATASSTVDVNSRFSRFQFSSFWSNGLASSVFILAPILLRFFYCLRLCKG